MPFLSCFERASPALKEILLKLYHAENLMELDHHLHEFGSVEYHIQCSAVDPNNTYLSIATPQLSHGVPLSHGFPHSTLEVVKRICSDVVEIVEPAREGYQLTLRLNFTKIPHSEDAVKMITEISTLQAVILSSQLKEILRNVSSKDASQGMYRPIKLVYHPREPFFIIKQPEKVTAVFPMRFKENSDVIIATAFFQELMDVGSSEAWAKAPPCIWSPIPPPELRGEPLEDLSTNGGFVSFADETVKQCTRGFIQRRMRNRLESLVEVLQKGTIEEDQPVKKAKGMPSA
ncbi:actin-related protein C2B [Actinidia rufa]|uniref:Arp2/3 complex 34 kDa subunit n=1 Tax=Actinidia rufa TaxID=165716 RepID=A0A7J0E8H9_9ERIC|nr:actin-related protein C2B [Actinidia rufa]